MLDPPLPSPGLGTASKLQLRLAVKDFHLVPKLQLGNKVEHRKVRIHGRLLSPVFIASFCVQSKNCGEQIQAVLARRAHGGSNPFCRALAERFCVLFGRSKRPAMAGFPQEKRSTEGEPSKLFEDGCRSFASCSQGPAWEHNCAEAPASVSPFPSQSLGTKGKTTSRSWRNP
jgi:hypothetical protein